MAGVFVKISPFQNETPVNDFIVASRQQLGQDLDTKSCLCILKDNWVENVHDVRILYRENELASLGLPDSVQRWIQIQCGKSFEEDSMQEPVVEVYKFQSPLDTNGIMYALATNKGTEKYENAGLRKLVLVTCSTIMNDSKPAYYVLGRDVVRCVTKPIENSWFQIDLQKHRVKPKHYMLRHYNSWDTEALRSWKFEASNDGRKWTMLREHHNDSSLNARGVAYAWELSHCNEFYSKFRIWQTGQNSNRHHYLSLSGFELWGEMKSIEEQVPVAVAPVVREVSAGRVFRYQYDFDINGILYYIGTQKGTQKWTNPSIAGWVEVSSSTKSKDIDIHSVVGRTASRCVSLPQQDSWFMINLKGRKVNPTHYTLRHYASYDTEALRNWYLQASNDGISWTNIMKHEKDESLKYSGATKTWNIPHQNTTYSMYRVFQYGVNSNQHWYLALSGFELYGTLYEHEDESKDEIDILAAQIQGNLGVADIADNTITCLFTHDFDTDGIVYYIGSAGKTKEWKNPAESKLIEVTSSSKMQDSVPLSSAVGREVCRCVTKPEKNSWFQFNFKSYSIKPTHYTLRHYDSWDTEALRNWRLEASTDGQHWSLLREHHNDTNLDKKGSTHTWEIPQSDRFYAHFRLFQTDVNSNNHYYLACCGFEMYGVLKLPGGVRHNPVRPVAADVPDVMRVGGDAPGPKHKPSFRYESDFDQNGICYYLGTKCGRQKGWENPVKHSLVNVTSSGLMQDSVGPESIVGRDTVRCVTKPTDGAWITIQFKNHFVRPTHYTLRHYSSWHTEALRNWALQGSNDDQTWEVIRDHANDDALQKKGAAHTWAIPDCQKYYSHFRLAQTGVNSNNHLYMAVSGFEIYGSLLELHPVLRFDNSSPHKSDNLHLENAGKSVVNTGNKDAWQSVRTVQSFTKAHSDVHYFEILVINSPKSSNSWLFMVGVVPPDFKCLGQKQWLGSQESWGYIAGTGGKCFNVGKSSGYGMPWGDPGNLLGCRCDFAKGTIEYFLNGVSQGVAFSNFRPKEDKAFPAVSLTANNSKLILVNRVDAGGDAQAGLHGAGVGIGGVGVGGVAGAGGFGIPAPGPQVRAPKFIAWDPQKISKKMTIDAVEGIALNSGSVDTWQIALSKKTFGLGKVRIEFEITSDVQTSNTWRFIFGCAPAKFEAEASGWLGSQKSWGYIAGTGGACHIQGKSMDYGEKFGHADRVQMLMDFTLGTIEFFKNGKSQGIPFKDLTGPVRVGSSMTGTGAAVRMREL